MVEPTVFLQALRLCAASSGCVWRGGGGAGGGGQSEARSDSRRTRVQCRKHGWSYTAEQMLHWLLKFGDHCRSVGEQQYNTLLN